MAKEEVGVELTFRRKYNLLNWNDKEYTLKLSGTESQIESQLKDHKQKLINYISQLEEIVDIANEASKLNSRVKQADGDKTN